MCTKKKLSYRRETARRAVSVETVQNIAQIRDVHEIFSAETETRPRRDVVSPRRD